MTATEGAAEARRDWALVGAGFLAVVGLAVVWLAIDRQPPAWDYANHLGRALRCAQDVAAGNVVAVLERSSFYPPLVTCAAGLSQRVIGSDVAGGQAVILGFLGLGMAATFLLGRRVAGSRAGVVAALVLAGAPFVVFLALRFQLDLPLMGMVALMLEVLLRTDGFQRRGWSVMTGVVAGLGMLTKPPFAAYVVPALVAIVVQIRGRRALVNAGVAALMGTAIALPWYAPRLVVIPGQLSVRSFKQAVEEGDPEPLTWAGLIWYPTEFVPLFGVAAVVLLCLGLVVALRRRRWWLLVALLVPFAIVSLIRNKDLRYVVPLLPLAAVMAGLGWSALPPRGRVASGVVLGAVTVLQVSATAFHVIPERIPGLGLRVVFASPPSRDDWHHRDILALIARESGGEAATVSVVPNHERFSVSNFRYSAARAGLALTFTRAWDEQPVGVEFMVVKTGDVGPSWTQAKIRRVHARLENDPYLTRAFPVIGEFPLPDGSVAVVRARRLAGDVAVPPATVAAAIERGLRQQAGDVARALDRFAVTLVWDDDSIREGRIRRIEIRAASATLGQFTRRDPAVLRVSDLRVLFDDVVVNPYSAAAGHRVDLLAVGAVRVDGATIAASDFEAFLRALPRFRPTVHLDRGALAVRVRQFGLDLTGRVSIAQAEDRPFAIVARDVRLGGVPLPAVLVDLLLRNFDPSGPIARRLPAPVKMGRVTITPEAIRIASDD